MTAEHSEVRRQLACGTKFCIIIVKRTLFLCHLSPPEEINRES